MADDDHLADAFPGVPALRIAWAHAVARRIAIHLARGNEQAAADSLRWALAEQRAAQVALGPAERLATPLADTGLVIRLVNALEGAGLRTVGDLCVASDARLRRVENLGDVAIGSIDRLLAELGFARRRESA